MRAAIISLALITIDPAFAASMNKCVDAQGRVTFTQQACPGGGAGQQIQVKSASEGMRIANPSEISPVQGSASGRNAYTHCSDMTQVDARYLIGHQKIQVGMSAEDAKESWGAPTKINRSSSGLDQWVYDLGPGKSQYLYVDSFGCVKAWN